MIPTRRGHSPRLFLLANWWAVPPMAAVKTSLREKTHDHSNNPRGGAAATWRSDG